jgi:hypothetical protein
MVNVASSFDGHNCSSCVGWIRAMAADLPTYEIMGFPITQHQLAAVNTAYIQQITPVPTLMVNGMPASPVQKLRF